MNGRISSFNIRSALQDMIDRHRMTGQKFSFYIDTVHSQKTQLPPQFDRLMTMGFLEQYRSVQFSNFFISANTPEGLEQRFSGAINRGRKATEIPLEVKHQKLIADFDLIRFDIFLTNDGKLKITSTDQLKHFTEILDEFVEALEKPSARNIWETHRTASFNQNNARKLVNKITILAVSRGPSVTNDPEFSTLWTPILDFIESV